MLHATSAAILITMVLYEAILADMRGPHRLTGNSPYSIISMNSISTSVAISCMLFFTERSWSLSESKGGLLSKAMKTGNGM